MKSLIKLTLAAVMFATTFAAQAGTVNGYFRSSGTFVWPHFRTQANGTIYDLLGYHCFPSQQPDYVSPPSNGLDSSWSRPTPLPSYGDYDFSEGLRPFTGDFTPKPLRRSTLLGF